jgi:tetratricopeptide (TPR) repeat protein
VFYLGARVITASRLEPTSPLIVRIVKFMEASRDGRRHALAPAFSDFIATEPFATARTKVALSSSERGVLTVAAAAVAAKKPQRAVSVLETHIAGQGLRAHPRMFERLADVHLAAGSFERAEDALQRGLSAHPSSGRLHLGLADTFSRMSKWDAATEHWEQVPDDLRATASVWASIGLARAYRLTGNPREANAIARRAAASQPGNDQLEREIELCRPFYFEWSRCLVSADELPRDGSTPAGIVESMGFLVGGVDPLVGRVTSYDMESPEVCLCINGLTVASTLAADPSGPASGKAFSINCADSLEYLGDGDIIQVVTEGRPVTLPEFGAAAIVEAGLPSRFGALEGKLRQGYVFTKFGRLRPGHTDESKREMLDFYEEVSSLIERSTGLTVFPFYGTLLGAIRENDFIAHDVGGFDMVVVCEGAEPADVKAEFAEIRRLLLERSYHLKPDPWGVMVRRQREDNMLLDLSYGWFNAADEFNVSFGWRFAPVRGRERLTTHRVCRLADRVVSVPANAEEVLAQLYGPQWRVPDQGYPVQGNLKRDMSYLMTEAAVCVLRERHPMETDR